MKLEVGMYVRLIRANKTNIRKINSIYEIYSKNKKERLLILDKSFEGCRYSIKESKIIKASFNIPDLIEKDDLVVIEYYVSKYRERISRIFEVTKGVNKLYFDNHCCRWIYDLDEHKFIQAKGYNPKIKSIVTHEQFENMKYEVE